ncbi:MAG: fimbrillin family protein [Rikenellaceae bacterium]|nr:fimbrillin family protein [Rikenellaceae bacterium]MCL2692681.1 fimbrillin family protein [Rikenellaceae bacterium]
MRQVLKITIFCLLTLAIAACSREVPYDMRDGTISFGIVPTIIESGSGEIAPAASRAKVDGVFPQGAMIGLGISAPSASPALASFYNSFYGWFNGATWFYYLNNVSTGDRLSGFSSWGAIEVYGYYPYNVAVTDFSAIPFRVADLTGTPGEAEGTDATAMTDYMVAGTQTKDMQIPSPAGDLPLQFGHMMTAIEFVVNRSTVSSGPVLRLGSVTFEISGGSPAREFVVSGTYTAINPDMTNLTNNVTPGDAATSMTISYPSGANITSTGASRRLLVIMPELRQTMGAGGADDATVTMTFRFIDQDGTPYLFEDIAGGNPSISFALSDITNSGTSDCGLLAGYSYAVTATIGTYTKFAAPTTGTPTPPHVNYDPLVDDPNSEYIDI